MNIRAVPIFLVAAMLPVACTVTGPADDGFANSQESVSIGRLFSDDDEGYTLYRSRKQPAGAADATTANPDDTEFRAFREWAEARRKNTPEYQKFKLWQEFEAFQRWREQQRLE